MYLLLLIKITHHSCMLIASLV